MHQNHLLDFSLKQVIERQPLTVAPETPLMEVIDAISQNWQQSCAITELEDSAADNLGISIDVSSVLVTAEEQLSGILTERDVVRLLAADRDLSCLTVAEVMSEQLVTLKATGSEDIFTALRLLCQHQIGHLPIVDRSDRLIGLVTQSGVRRALRPTDLLKVRRVEEVMKTKVIQAAPTTSVFDVVRLMTRHQVSCVVITETQDPELVYPIGMITERDIIQFQRLELNLKLLSAQTVMSAPPFAIKSADSLWEAYQQMQQHRVRRVVVIGEQGELVGIVTQTSLLQMLDPIEMYGVIERLQQKVQHLETENHTLSQSHAAQIEKQRQREQLIAESTNRLRRTLDLAAILKTTVTEVRKFLGADRVLVCQFDQEMKTKMTAESVAPGWTVTLGRTIEDTCFQGGNEAEAYRQGQKRAITDIYNAGLADCHIQLLEQFEVKAYLIVPIVVAEKLWGLLIAHQCIGVRDWQEVELELLDQLAGQLAIAIGQAQLYQQAQAEIEERQQAERKLRESESRFRQIAENVREVFFIVSLDPEQLIYISPAYEEIWGRSRESVYRQPHAWLESIHPEDRKQTMEALATRSKTGKEFDVEYRIIRPDGSVRWIWSRSFPIHNEAGEVYRFTGIAEDITARKLSEQKIQQQAALLDVATDAIFVRDLENRIIFWNRGAEQIYGWTKQEALGKNVRELVCRGDTSFLQKIWQTVLTEGEWRGEIPKVTKAGKELIIESHWSLVKDEAGNPKAILSVDTDITEKKQLEAQFLRAQRLESLGTLTGGIAHDLNNILTPILAVTQLLPRHLPHLDQQSRQMLTIAENNTKRGAALVKQVLSFSRGVEGKRENLQIAAIVAEVEQIITQTFPKSISLETQLPKDLTLIWGDSTQIHQVLMNLCINARDAMPQGGTLTITAENCWLDEVYARTNLEAQVGAYVAISVTDTGNGMSADILERIFEPFFTTKEIGKGTGLGLSTVIGIIKSHNGFVKVYSELGVGTQFKVYLPATETAQQRSPASQELPTGRGELILVVDDEATIRKITKSTLQSYNYRALTAADGMEAIALYARHQAAISAVLIDLMMPSMDGLTAIRTLCKIDPQVKIIATSGLTAKEKATAAEKAGAQMFLSKPYTAQALLLALKEVISRGSLA